MARAIGRSDLIEDERFDSIQKLSQNSAELRSIFGEIFKTDSAEHWDDVLRNAGVPSGVLKRPPDTLKHPQLAFRNSIGSIDDVPGVKESLRFLGAGFLVDSMPTTPEVAPPLLGEHSRDRPRGTGLRTRTYRLTVAGPGNKVPRRRVAIVGGGNAAFCAAISAREHGAEGRSFRESAI